MDSGLVLHRKRHVCVAPIDFALCHGLLSFFALASKVGSFFLRRGEHFILKIYIV